MTATIPTPLGPMLAAATDAGVALCDFADRPGAAAAAARLASAGGSDHLDRLRSEIAGYFAGRRTTFSTPLATPVGTRFQKAAWAFLATIPFGQTRSYGQQAAGVGSPAAARAVGRANGANPLCLLVPCHRVDRRQRPPDRLRRRHRPQAVAARPRAAVEPGTTFDDLSPRSVAAPPGRECDHEGTKGTRRAVPANTGISCEPFRRVRDLRVPLRAFVVFRRRGVRATGCTSGASSRTLSP